ncbi:acyltransferase family protein [Streptomyces guryensis]|uniref:Acyltransferase n=1 Tax=Streptomyces guryensis TaxID=2886947 RepID=A0A9Q3VT63_9ACTN|nr:acyltransferase [Streptomyces guryensis]MCD9876831.1 acyltransferase [Streptomyces guryensis]
MPGLDGLRGLAALYVVLFHCWLLSFPGFPENSGPSWLGWLMYGRLAVVFFLVLSGFSLALSPARNGWHQGGVARFLRRRARRILPPYWAALVLSVAVAFFVVRASHHGPPNARTVVVYGLLLQDAFTARTPNGAFWSIAVEAELYLLFPLLLFVRRRLGAAVLVTGVTLLAVGRGLLAGHASPVEGDNWLAPDLAPVFVAGLVGAGIIVAREKVRRLPWHWLAAFSALPVMSLISVRGSSWTVNHYFWVDLAVAPAMTMFLAAVATGRPVFLMRLLTTAPMRSLGNSSYSLYLIHLPIIMVIVRKIAPDHASAGLPTFWFTTILGLPASIVSAWLFSEVFEVPFKRNRSNGSRIDPLSGGVCGVARRVSQGHAGMGRSRMDGAPVGDLSAGRGEAGAGQRRAAATVAAAAPADCGVGRCRHHRRRRGDLDHVASEVTKDA